MSETAKKRAPNFSLKESTLLNIVANYKEIIENKKTDGVTWRQKDDAWTKITSIFNSQIPENCPRSKESLRKLYDNIKKDVRKKVSYEKKELSKTGGGKPEDKPNQDPTVELALGIMNEKTVYGLKNPFDSDGDSTVPETSGSKEAYSTVTEFRDDIPTCYIDSSLEHSYCINQMTDRAADSEQVLTNWGDFSVSNLRQPPAKELKHQWAKRRRPNIQQLTSSQLTEEYLKLAKMKQELYIADKENILKRDYREQQIFELQKKLQLDIDLKELEIKKFKYNL